MVMSSYAAELLLAVVAVAALAVLIAAGFRVRRHLLSHIESGWPDD